MLERLDVLLLILLVAIMRCHFSKLWEVLFHIAPLCVYQCLALCGLTSLGLKSIVKRDVLLLRRVLILNRRGRWRLLFLADQNDIVIPLIDLSTVALRASRNIVRVLDNPRRLVFSIEVPH
jgi:hypothetical protein